MCRGNNGDEIFFKDQGRFCFLETLGEVCGQTGWRVHAYCLMSNHYHLLLETSEANLVEGMKWFQGTYTQRINAMMKRRGHLFQGRYKAIPVQTDPRQGGLVYFRQVSTYIYLNPYRAGICGVGKEKPLESFRWSSYPHFIGRKRKHPEWLERKKVYRAWGIKGTKNECEKAYRHKIQRKMKCIEDPDAGRAREFEEQIKRGWFLGSERFRESLQPYLSGQTKKDTYRGQQRKDHGKAEAERILKVLLAEFGLEEKELIALKSTHLTKQVIAWSLKMNTTVSGTWIADRLEMGHRVNASRAINKIRVSTEREIEQVKE
jgi:REP element-mobilizing transposase RayT